MITQKEIILPPFARGFHLITPLVEKAFSTFPDQGLLNLFICHTSAALTINENADPTVRYDFEQITDRLVPERMPDYTHTLEGDDDMPAHVKSSLYGTSLTIPVRRKKLALGTWQGIYLCEFRNRGGQRKIIATIFS